MPAHRIGTLTIEGNGMVSHRTMKPDKPHSSTHAFEVDTTPNLSNGSLVRANRYGLKPAQQPRARMDRKLFC